MVRPVHQFVKGIVHPAHDHIARQEIGHGQPKRRRRKQIPIVCVHVVAVALTDAEPAPFMRRPGQQDDHGIVTEVGTVPQRPDAFENGSPREAPFFVASAADHVRDGLNRHNRPLRKTQVPEGTIGPLQQR